MPSGFFRKNDLILVNGSITQTSTMYRVLSMKCTWDYYYNMAGRTYYEVESLDGLRRRRFYAEAINGKLDWNLTDKEYIQTREG